MIKILFRDRFIVFCVKPEGILSQDSENAPNLPDVLREQLGTSYVGTVHRLDREAERNFVEAKAQGLDGMELTHYIDEHMDMANVLKTSMPDFDGGYVMCGLTGSGEMFSMRDPWGIRPAFYYANDEFVAVASERPVLQTTFDLDCEDILELQPGHALLVSRQGKVRMEQILQQRGDSACSFERIYFSRGSDRDIYRERKMLGELLVPQVLKAVDSDVDHTVFSFIHVHKP